MVKRPKETTRKDTQRWLVLNPQCVSHSMFVLAGSSSAVELWWITSPLLPACMGVAITGPEVIYFFTTCRPRTSF